jgi:NTP pyrophosphatase (non-canonical NTP hydrolase)
MPEIERQPKCDVCGRDFRDHTADCPHHAYRPGAEADPGLEARIRAEALARTEEAARRRRSVPVPDSVPLTFAAFSAANLARCESPDGFGHALGSWSLSDWFTAAMGELGEAANVAKKLNRVRDGITGNTQGEAELRAKLRAEVADAIIYLDLLAQSQGFDLGGAVRETFDRKSEQIGYPRRLGDGPPHDPGTKGALAGQMIEGVTFGFGHATPAEALGAVVARTGAVKVGRRDG